MDSGERSPKELEVDAWINAVKQFRRLGGTSLTFSGGEPLLFAGLFSVAAAAKAMGLETLLITNGTLVANAELAHSLEDVIDTVRVSVDGATREGYETIRGPGAFDQVQRALVLLADAGIPVELAVALYPENTSDLVANLPAFLAQLKEQGVDPTKVRIGRGMLRGRASGVLGVLDFEEKFLRINRDIYGKLWGLDRFRSLRVNSCGFGSSLTVSSVGRVYPCGLFCDIGVDIEKEELQKIFTRFQRVSEESCVAKMYPCRDCDIRYICGGGCRVRHLESSGDVCRPECSEHDRETYYRRLMIRDEVFFSVSDLLD
jgi:radical SAM protein with 4Fe4S-binding SPASM domain